MLVCTVPSVLDLDIETATRCAQAIAVEMDKQTVFKKTAKGTDEIATRAHKLPARVRSLLILLDGRRTTAEVLAQASHLGDAEKFLARLQEDGFIEAANLHSVPPPLDEAVQEYGAIPEREAGPTSLPPYQQTPVAAFGTDPSVDRMAAFMATKAFATRYFIDLLGPDSDSLTKKIEGAKTEGQLLLLMERCREIVQQVKGRDRAERFWQRVHDMLEGGL